MNSFPVRRSRRPLLAGPIAMAILSAFLATGCLVDDGEEPELLEEELLLGPEFTNNAVAVAWNQIAFDAALAHDGFGDFAVNLRGFTIMHLAMHDALNTIVPAYVRFALGGLVRPLAHPTAAAAQAARDVLVATYPAQAATFNAQLATWLAGVPNGLGKTQGIQLGKDAAAAVIANRASDNMTLVGTYAPDPTPEPGDYQFVPPLTFVFRPAFGDARPFGLNNGSQFRPGPPPGLTTPTYATSYNEVKAKGVLTGSTRTADQAHEAQWWYEFGEQGWNRIANLLVRQRNTRLYPAARGFALMNMGIMDAYVAVWNAKRHYDAWRPYTAIRAGDTDGNAATAPDPAWEPFCVTPPVQEYPSAHAMQAAAAADMLVNTFGTDSISFTATSTTAPPGQPNRSFTSLRAAGVESGDSRVMCGIHFRFAVTAGTNAGRQIASFILANKLKPTLIPPP